MIPYCWVKSLLLKICHQGIKKIVKKYSYFCYRHTDGGFVSQCIWQYRVNSMIRKTFTVWKERKQSHCRRRRKPAFPNCEPIDEQLSDNVLSMFIFVWFLRYTLQQRRRCRIIFFFTNTRSWRIRLKCTPIDNHNVARYGARLHADSLNY